MSHCSYFFCHTVLIFKQFYWDIIHLLSTNLKSTIQLILVYSQSCTITTIINLRKFSSPHYIQKIAISNHSFSPSSQREMQFDDESKCWNYSRRGRELRVMGNIQNFKEQGNIFSPRASREKYSPVDTWILLHRGPSQTSDLQN